MIALKNWVKEILLADVFNFDLWSIKIELNSTTGHFNQVQNGKTMILKHKIDGDNGEKVGDTVRVLNKMCCNYFSTGVESRIGFGFEKKRSKSHYMNKIYYGTESLKKLFLKKHVRVNEYVKKIMYEYEGEEIVVVPKDSFSSNPISLIFQNIPSMASGCDFWVGSYKYADKIREKMMKEKKDYNAELNTNLSKVKQEIGDGKIELMTIKSLCYYSKAQAGMPRGVAKRITQAKGPFSLEFNENYNNKVYFQIDGENYSCIHPISFAVKYSKSYQILVKKGSKLTKTSVQSKISESNISHLSNEKNYATRTYSNPPSPAVLTPVDMISPNASFVSDGEEGGETWKDTHHSNNDNYTVPTKSMSALFNSPSFDTLREEDIDIGLDVDVGVDIKVVESEKALNKNNKIDTEEKEVVKSEMEGEDEITMEGRPGVEEGKVEEGDEVEKVK